MWTADFTSAACSRQFRLRQSPRRRVLAAHFTVKSVAVLIQTSPLPDYV